MKVAYLRALCDVRDVGFEQTLRAIQKYHTFTNDPEVADLIIFEHCVGGASRIETSLHHLSTIFEAKAQNPTMKVALVGCSTTVKLEPFSSLVDYTFSSREDLVKFLTKESSIWLPYNFNDGKLDVRVAVGCNQPQICSFCKRNYRDFSYEYLPVENLRFLETIDGVSWVSFLAHDLTNYPQLLELIGIASRNPNIQRISISALCLSSISRSLKEEIFTNPKIQIVGIAIESASDYLLTRMEKGFSEIELYSFFEELRKYRPDIAIFTNVIVGFPGETKADVTKTIRFLSKMKIYNILLYKYDDSEKIPSHYLDGHLSEETINEFYKIWMHFCKTQEKKLFSHKRPRIYRVDNIKGDEVFLWDMEGGGPFSIPTTSFDELPNIGDVIKRRF